MIFTNRKQSFINVNITIQNERVSQEKSMKYLGVTFSEDLSWHEHIDKWSPKTWCSTTHQRFLGLGYTLYSLYVSNTATRARNNGRSMIGRKLFLIGKEQRCRSSWSARNIFDQINEFFSDSQQPFALVFDFSALLRDNLNWNSCI
jgi:hypothetical protein